MPTPPLCRRPIRQIRRRPPRRQRRRRSAKNPTARRTPPGRPAAAPRRPRPPPPRIRRGCRVAPPGRSSSRRPGTTSLTESESRGTSSTESAIWRDSGQHEEAEMDHRGADSGESRFAGYVEGLASVIGHKDREGPLRDYCTGLMMPCERKSVEPMAAVTAPARVAAQHQSLLHFVGEGRWSDAPVLAKIREMVLPQMQRHGPIEAWIIDDTGFPKQGRHSVGVARQYCGQLGKEDNCQVAVSLSLANRHASLPVAYRLYLPQEWANDHARLRKAGVPEDIGFKTKHEIALDQLRWACAAELPRGVVRSEE